MTDSNVHEYKTVSFFTLGCKLNFAESSAIGKALKELGIRNTKEGEKPDLCVVNTCSVTDLADKKCRQTIRKIHREYPEAKIIVTGCYAQLKPQEIAQIEGVDLVLGAAEKIDLPSYLSLLDKEKGLMHSQILHTPIGEISTFSHSLSAEGRTRHFLKVQDGCDYNCSYCTIPKARGKSRNGSIDSLLTQAKNVVEEGGKEIVLTGVNVGDFGKSTGENLYDLLTALNQLEGLDRIRISSIEPNLITDEIIALVASSKRLAPHFHIPLQSGSNEVLRLMRRRYSSDLFAHKVQLIKRLIPHAFIGVDVIVGTRGEREELFEESYQFIASLDISQLHVFSYSERPGTDALKIEHNVTTKEKQYRSHRLIELSQEKLKNFYLGERGKVRRLLVEHSSKTDGLYGYTENYIRVRLPYTEGLHGKVRKVILEDISVDESEVMTARLLES